MLNSKSLIKVSAGLLLVSTIGFSGKAHAQTVDVPFSGLAPNSCAFGTPTAGTLAKTGALAAMEGGVGVTGMTNGTAGKVTVTCSSGGTVSAAVPTVVVKPAAFNPTITQAVVQLGATNTFTSSPGTQFAGIPWNRPTVAMPIPASATPNDLNVAMITGATTNGTVPTGTYSYTVRLTATSN